MTTQALPDWRVQRVLDLERALVALIHDRLEAAPMCPADVLAAVETVYALMQRSLRGPQAQHKPQNARQGKVRV